MKIVCDHGYYTYEPDQSNELNIFQARFRLSLVQRRGNEFTFAALKDLPNYSLQGSVYGSTGLTATETYSGNHPSEVLRANGWIFDLTSGKVLPLAAITDRVIFRKNNFSYSQKYPTMQAGSTFSDGTRLLSFAAVWSERVDEARIYSFEAST